MSLIRNRRVADGQREIATLSEAGLEPGHGLSGDDDPTRFTSFGARSAAGSCASSITSNSSFDERDLKQSRSWNGSCIGKLCFFFSNIVLPCLVTVQMGVLDFGYIAEFSLVWCSFFALADFLLVLHMLLYHEQAQAVQGGSLWWIVYTWLISLKSSVLYFGVLPELDRCDSASLQSNGISGSEKVCSGKTIFGISIFSANSVFTLMCLTPINYCILTFRTLRQFFPQPGQIHRRGHSQHDVTLDVMLLQDMVWHVIIDIIDIIYMLFMSTPHDKQLGLSTPSLLKTHPKELKTLQEVAGVFVFLGLFFHQQSFPKACSTAVTHNCARGRDSHVSRAETCEVGGETTDSQILPDAGVDIVGARKRSAIVSILFVDLPFFSLRTFLYVISLQGDIHRTKGSDDPGGLPTLDKWWVKNIVCMLLQAMQLRFMQQADLEQSQLVKTWSVQGSEHDISKKRYRRRWMQTENVQLRNYWQRHSQERRKDCNANNYSPDTGRESHQNDESQEQHAEEEMMESTCTQGSIPLASWKHLHKSCCCSLTLWIHALLGLMLGWFIAKSDFAAAMTHLAGQ